MRIRWGASYSGLLFGQQGAGLVIAHGFEFAQQVLVIGAGLFDLLQLDGFGQLGHGKIATVDHFERKLDAEELADAGEQLHGQQGMAAQLEEIFIDADRGQVQQLGPKRGKLSFRRGAGGNGRHAPLGDAAGGVAQAPQDRFGGAKLVGDTEVVGLAGTGAAGAVSGSRRDFGRRTASGRACGVAGAAMVTGSISSGESR